MTSTQWQPTRHGGVRRVDPTTGSSARLKVGPQESDLKAERVATLNAEGDEDGGNREERLRPTYFGSTRRRAVVRFHLRGLGEIRLAWNEKLGIPGCEYLTRTAVETRFGALRLHSWTGPDDDRAKHDHPWWFLTFVLRGGYTDLGVEGNEHLRAPAVRFRPAEHQHTVVPDPDGALTFLITGPKSRQWGFWVDGRFRKAIKYFSKYGHHPCD